MKKSLVCSLVMIFLLMFWTGAASAELISIGTATYTTAPNAINNNSLSDTANVYKLIYDADSPFGPITWLVYTNGFTDWDAQGAWAAGLDSALTINLNSGYSVNWDDSWRLPNAAGGSGYNKTESEMGHLYYTELGNSVSLTNTGDFNNLFASWYWSGTEYAFVPGDPYDAWGFSMFEGNQDFTSKSIDGKGLAVRSGQVSVVPEPTTMLLLGVGLLGIAGVSRRRNQ